MLDSVNAFVGANAVWLLLSVIVGLTIVFFISLSILQGEIRQAHSKANTSARMFNIMVGNAATPFMYYLLDKNFKAPTRGHKGDAGLDLYVRAMEYLDKDNNVLSKHDPNTPALATKIRYFYNIKIALPRNKAGFLRMRSSVSEYDVRMSNADGTIDRIYRGEIMAIFDIIGPRHYKVGDKGAQLVIVDVNENDWIEVDDVAHLGYTERADGGYGSTGK